MIYIHWYDLHSDTNPTDGKLWSASFSCLYIYCAADRRIMICWAGGLLYVQVGRTCTIQDNSKQLTAWWSTDLQLCAGVSTKWSRWRKYSVSAALNWIDLDLLLRLNVMVLITLHFKPLESHTMLLTPRQSSYRLFERRLIFLSGIISSFIMFIKMNTEKEKPSLVSLPKTNWLTVGISWLILYIKSKWIRKSVFERLTPLHLQTKSSCGEYLLCF